MGLLAVAHYDPAVAVSFDTRTAELAMTAFDTTNLRLTFPAPANGRVLVRMAGCHYDNNMPALLLGILEGATVRARVAPTAFVRGLDFNSGFFNPIEAVFIVPGLTPGASYTWDAAYGVEAKANASNAGIKYGGPNDATTGNAWGGFSFEIYDASNCLAAALYDPATAASVAAASLTAMTALDTTNLRLTFTAPASGRVGVNIGTLTTGNTTVPQILLGVLEGATVRGRAVAQGAPSSSGTVSAVYWPAEARFIVPGLTPGNSYTWDAAFSVETAGGSGAVFKWGGPNNAIASDAWGAARFAIFQVD